MHTNIHLWLKAFLYLLSFKLYSPRPPDVHQSPSLPARCLGPQGAQSVTGMLRAWLGGSKITVQHQALGAAGIWHPTKPETASGASSPPAPAGKDLLIQITKSFETQAAPPVHTSVVVIQISYYTNKLLCADL